MTSILYIAQFFSVETEPGGQGQRHYKHAKALVEDGHHVTVITSGCTTMQSGQSGQLSTSGSSTTSEWNHPNLTIIKLPVEPMNKRSVLSRAKRYFAFNLKALATGLTLLLIERKRFHFVLGSSPPLLIALVAYLLSIVARAEFCLEIRDLWSQTMAANGFIKNKPLIALNRWLESWLYTKAKKIIIVSEAFASEIIAQAPHTGHKIMYIPNGADMEFYQYPKLWKGSYLREAEADRNLFHVNYTGVFSDYTRLETLLETAAQLQESAPDIRFNLVGGGYQFDSIRQLAEQMNLKNVCFWEALPKNRINKFTMEGDLSIINYRNLDIYGQVLPNKLFDYMASGRPILAAVPQGEVSRILDESGCGFCVEPENVTALIEKIMWFYNHREQGLKMGFQGQNYVRRHFNRNLLVTHFLALFPRVIPINPSKRREVAAATEPANNVVLLAKKR